MKKISIIHPTRGRKAIALATITKWIRSADNDIEYILSIDSDDKEIWPQSIYYSPKNEFDGFPIFVKILESDNKSAIEAINNAAKLATGDIIIVISDDFDCQSNWDTKLLNHIKGRADFCAKTIDGIQPTLITMPIMDRVYYERYGYVYHPSYGHMFADQELTAIAIMTGKYLKFNMLFEHLHYTTGKTQFDEVNAKNNATWAQGESLFNERLKSNFGIDNPVVPYSEIQWR